jgi:hypothetical protein
VSILIRPHTPPSAQHAAIVGEVSTANAELEVVVSATPLAGKPAVWQLEEAKCADANSPGRHRPNLCLWELVRPCQLHVHRLSP